MLFTAPSVASPVRKMNLAGEKMLSKQRRAQVEMVLVASEGVTTGYAVDARADIFMMSSETISKRLEQTLFYV